MKFLIILLILSILWCGFFFPFIFRSYARKSADEIINGHRPSTEKRFNTCISFLTWSNKWITNRAYKDLIRIRKLNDILKEMQKPHG